MARPDDINPDDIINNAAIVSVRRKPPDPSLGRLGEGHIFVQLTQAGHGYAYSAWGGDGQPWSGWAEHLDGPWAGWFVRRPPGVGWRFVPD
jgi:hypothetical protein